ncbi:MAG: protein-L-isoaspartate(D-aspartate) O-methyltransferase [Gammaproteobacteria bacterium]
MRYKIPLTRDDALGPPDRLRPVTRTLPRRVYPPGRAALFALGIILIATRGADAGEADEYAAARLRMVDTIEQEFRWTASMVGPLDPAVAEIMRQVPRHRFVPDDYQGHAYLNQPLPIGYGQTISQPYIVALMTDLLDAGSAAVVLEIGTGSGYQAAVLAELVKEVYTIEIIEPLGKLARERLRRLGKQNVHARIGDGYFGWQEHAPFDGILVTAAGDHIPPPLVAQLKPGGKLVMPVGGFLTQYLVLVEKAVDGSVTTRQLLPVQFVPLTGGH